MKNIYSLEYVKETAESILHKVSNIYVDDKKVHVTSSIGIHVVEDILSYQEIFESADCLMYIAKNAGGNQYRVNM